MSEISPEPAVPAGSAASLVPILFGHAAFQQLNAGVELGLFELLRERPHLDAAAMAEALGIPARSVGILLLGTTALGLTDRRGGVYRNAPVLEAMFDDGSWPVIREIVEFQARISYRAAADYTESLRTGRNAGIRQFPGDTRDLYSRLANVPGLEQLFYRGMHAWSELSNPVLVDGVSWQAARRVLDVGGGDGVNAIALAQRHPHLSITVMDRCGALDVAAERILAAGLADRVHTQPGDIFAGDYPAGYDTVLFAHQLVIWSPEQNVELLGHARRCLADDGRVLVFNAFTNDEGDGPLYAALDSVYFTTLPFDHSNLYPWRDYEQWLSKAGFAGQRRIPGTSWTPHGVIESFATPTAAERFAPA